MVAREVALKMLIKENENEAYSNLLVSAELDKSNLNDLDKTLVTKIVYGVISSKITLDYIISKLSKIKLKKLSVAILNILRMGIYQLYFLDKIPVSAACNESVKLAKKYGHVSSANFVNAILRNVARRNLEGFLNEIEDFNEKLSVKYSYPLWMVDLFINKYGKEKIEEVLKANNLESNSCIRVNTLKITRDELIGKLNKEEIGAIPGKLEDIIYIKDVKKALVSKYFNDGYYAFQDEAPALVAHLLKPAKGDKTLDMCSAPGGKTTHIAQMMENCGEITALELYENRASLVRDLATKLGINSINVLTFDATIYNEQFENYFDKIVADVPCSGLGVIRRKPDIKWNTQASDIEELTIIQHKIINNAAGYLKSGGRLVYSTCTWVDRENSDMVNKFLSEHPEFTVEKIIDIPEEFKTGLTSEGYLELAPFREGTDGFFIAVLRKM